MAAAADENLSVDYDAARERVYGMPYSQWKAEFQGEASAEQLAGFEKNKPE
jgi:hypothetical protein